jgi:uncharacterized membrane protein
LLILLMPTEIFAGTLGNAFEDLYVLMLVIYIFLAICVPFVIIFIFKKIKHYRKKDEMSDKSLKKDVASNHDDSFSQK